MEALLEKHSGEMLIIILAILVLSTLLVIVPQLLRAAQHSNELRSAEHIRAIEEGQTLPPFDARSRAAGRTAALVPMVTVISAATVTCFLVAYRYEQLFAISVAVWAVAGLVSLAAVTGGVALMGRLAQLESGDLDEEEEESRT